MELKPERARQDGKHARPPPVLSVPALDQVIDAERAHPHLCGRCSSVIAGPSNGAAYSDYGANDGVMTSSRLWETARIESSTAS